MSQKRSSTYNPQPGGHHPGGEATKREREDIQTPHRGSIPQGPSVPEKQKNADRSFLYRSTEGLMNSAGMDDIHRNVAILVCCFHAFFSRYWYLLLSVLDGSNVSEQSRNINQRSTSKVWLNVYRVTVSPSPLLVHVQMEQIRWIILRYVHIISYHAVDSSQDTRCKPTSCCSIKTTIWT